MKYIKQLDSLRAIAVLLVIIRHWVPLTNIVNRALPLGTIGVNIFFVLSGFLITKILFDNKNSAEHFNISKGSVLKAFYFRRALRIFPIYYLIIFTLLIFHRHTDTDIKPAFAFYATYTSNFYLFSTNSFDGMITHLWTLAVEEQFYLIWPWIILFTNRKYLLPVITGFIVIGALSSFLLSEMKFSNVLTFTCFDAFGLGALLSWQITYGTRPLLQFYKALSFCALASALLFILYLNSSQSFYFPGRTIISVIALWLITHIIIHEHSKKPAFTFIWNNKVLIFLGKISYGLYLYHALIGNLNLKIINKYINPRLPDILFKKYWIQLFYAENIIMVLLISWLSYVLIEKRFLRLKKYFIYKEVANRHEMANSL